MKIQGKWAHKNYLDRIWSSSHKIAVIPSSQANQISEVKSVQAGSVKNGAVPEVCERPKYQIMSSVVDK